MRYATLLTVIVMAGMLLLSGCAESMHQVRGGVFVPGSGYGYADPGYSAPGPWYSSWWPWWGPGYGYYPGSYWGPGGWWGGYGHYGGRWWSRPNAPAFRPGPSRIPPQFRKR